MSANANSVAQKFKYNGKEIQDELGLDMYDYGARHYDPALGRWFGIDPLAEDYHSSSPYAFVGNNPMTNLEIDGRFWIRTVGDDGSISYEAEDGDSALSLYEQFGEQDGFTAEEAIDIVEIGVGRDNYNRESDGMLMSNVEEEDSFSMFIGEAIETQTVGTMFVVPDDSDVVETADNLSEDNFESQKDTVIYNKEQIQAFAENAKTFLEFIKPDPVSKYFKSKGTRQTSKSRTSRNIKKSKSRTEVSGQGSSNTNTSSASSTRQISVRGHFRTLKSGRKIWIKPHTRTIQNKSN